MNLVLQKFCTRIWLYFASWKLEKDENEDCNTERRSSKAEHKYWNKIKLCGMRLLNSKMDPVNLVMSKSHGISQSPLPTVTATVIKHNQRYEEEHKRYCYNMCGVISRTRKILNPWVLKRFICMLNLFCQNFTHRYINV